MEELWKEFESQTFPYVLVLFMTTSYVRSTYICQTPKYEQCFLFANF